VTHSIGDTVFYPELAKTYRRLAKYGGTDFYKGKIARDIVLELTKRGKHMLLVRFCRLTIYVYVFTIYVIKYTEIRIFTNSGSKYRNCKY
jgi:hypothetical protein